MFEVKPLPDYTKLWKISRSNVPTDLFLISDFIIKKALTFKKELANREVHVDLTCVKNRYIKYLNKKHRNKNKTTNVLSFPLEFTEEKEEFLQILEENPEMPLNLGDIFVSTDYIKTESAKLDREFSYHFLHMICHGALHLVGYNHENDKEESIMNDIEEKIMTFFNMPKPR
ncbi:rRNA maturation RNase YbeY [Candidatus Nesciobacter abundans]|uniref:Endoribonuclease YbeY n=1 Tax=Candidatus Nesciobacter abundans TaxID=2601668 RepID=A0A5C0UFX9_9PROT|nr:rRNA maturation RNase YbeY [Candidatus Nesciobacter abundans]QEK38958.1 rRNA maturation RNase YbeY [Candidatus Nesciobacter abundans]